MPAFNGTGPQGYGPKTGGGFGRCAQDASQTPYYGVGRGGFPRGGGQGFAFGGRGGRCVRSHRLWERMPSDAQQEQEWLRQQAQSLQEQLRQIEARLAELSRSTA